MEDQLNKRQVKVLWCSVTLIVIQLLYPPWRFALRMPPRLTLFVDAEYSFIFKPPKPTKPKVETPKPAEIFKPKEKTMNVLDINFSEKESRKSTKYFHGYDENKWIAEVNFNRLIIPVLIVLIIGFSLIISLKSKSERT